MDHKREKNSGVQSYWRGCLGKTKHRMVTVHLGFAHGDFHLAT
jgi:hypothetical protein